MASAVEQLVNGYNTPTPVSFTDFYNAYGTDKQAAKGRKWYNSNPNSLPDKFLNFFTGTATSAKQEYENYLNSYEFAQNKKARDEENAKTWAREDSVVQRSVNDITKAGLNPWLALNGGSMSSAMVSSQSANARYKMKEQQLKDDNKKSSLLGTALKVLISLAILMS